MPVFILGRKGKCNMKLLKQLTGAFGVSGRENSVREILTEELSELGEISISPLGNLTLHIKGKGEKILFAAHMDEIGLMVTYIEENGFLRFTAVGGVDPVRTVGSRIRFENGVLGIVECGEKKDTNNIKISDLYIDISAADAKEASKYVNIGDMAVFDGKFIQHGRFVTSKALDNRIGCYVLAEAAKSLAKKHKDVYMVFTAQEEVGLRGAKTAAENINPDFAFAVDITAAGDYDKKLAVKTGGGICIKVRDNSVISHADARDMIKSSADKLKLKYQYEVLPYGGCDAGALQLCCGGIKTGALSVPIRYVHTVNETANISDIKDAIRIVAKMCE